MIKEKGNIAERRKAPRVKGDFTVEIADQKTRIIADTINISALGIYCQSDHAIPLFREIQVAIMLPGVSKPIGCSGVVVRSEKIPRKERYNLAIFFEDILPEDKEQLSKYIEKKLVS